MRAETMKLWSAEIGRPSRGGPGLLFTAPSVSATDVRQVEYGCDQQLRRGGVVVAGFRPGGDGSHGHILAGERELAIVRGKRSGWRFSLVDEATGAAVCRFHHSRVARGGLLVGEQATVAIRGVPLRPGLWSVSSEEGWRTRLRYSGGRQIRIAAGGESSAWGSPDDAALLAFACWLVVTHETGAQSTS